MDHVTIFSSTTCEMAGKRESKLESKSKSTKNISGEM
jgi:hypothetical protein